MESKEIFSMALKLESPWFVSDVSMFRPDDLTSGVIEIQLDFKVGSRFIDSKGVPCPVHDTVTKKWRHLNFFEHTCFIHARVPRIVNSDGKVVMIEVPWARSNSGFTLMFEALGMLFIESEMPVKKAANVMKIHDTRLWRVFHYWVTKAFNQDIQKDVINIGIDETSSRKGHNYVSLAVDMDSRRVIFVTKGKDQTVIQDTANHIINKGCTIEQIKNISIDMSPAFIAGTVKYFPKSHITFDKFHVTKLLNESMDEVRKLTRKGNKELIGSKYLFLKRDSDLSNSEKNKLNQLLCTYDTLAQAYRLKEMFSDFWELSNVEQASGYLSFWCDQALDSSIMPFKKFVKMLKAHWSGITNYFNSKLNNGILEGINSKIQLAKKRARGFKNIDNFINMIYFIAGKLKFDYPL